MRIKRGIVTRRKHNKLLRLVKGYRMTKSRLVKVAKEASLHAGQYAFAGRRLRKRDMRRLWITRVSMAIQKQGMSYSTFIAKLKKAKIELDRKSLDWMLRNDASGFTNIVDKVKSN
jgi:large subunit ribosomal protein L20